MSSGSQHLDAAAAAAGPRSTTDVAGRTVADVMHTEIDGLPPTVTVGELRDWFAISPSRRLAVIAADGRYVASLASADIDPAERPDRPALEVARDRPTLAAGMPAAAGGDRVVATPERRLPVVDDDGRLRGVLAVTTDRRFFACRPAPAPH